MAKSKRKHPSSQIHRDIGQLEPVPQMRDLLEGRSRFLARRFVNPLKDTIRKFETARRLQTEDLRHESNFVDNNQIRVYRCEDGSVAETGWDFYSSSKLPQQKLRSPLRFVFRDSKGTLVCYRRRARRAVLFALQRTGKAGKRNRPARWTEKSRIVCKRIGR